MERFNNRYELFYDMINRAFLNANNGLSRYLFETLPVESVGDDSIVAFNCITECIAVLSSDIYDNASLLFSDVFTELFESYTLIVKDFIINLHSDLNNAVKQFIDELNNSGNRISVMKVSPYNAAFTNPVLADSFQDFRSACGYIAACRESEE